MHPATKGAVSAIVGAVLAPYLVWVWAQLAAHGLFVSPAIALGFSGNDLHAVLAPLDFAVAVLLVLPAAWLIWRLDRDRVLMHVALALVAFFAVLVVLMGPPRLSLGFWAAVSTFSPYLALPVAVWLVAKFSRGAPNNSFKPKPLRGSA